MPVNPAYRGFCSALDAIERGADPWAAYERHYLRPHCDVLTAYWRQLWGADEERVREIVNAIRPRDYQALRDSLRALDVDAFASEALGRCSALTDLPEPQVDLLVGRFSPDAFLLEVAGQWHIGVGLERFADFSHLPLFVAHEYGHCARRLLAPQSSTLGDRLVGEGAAVAFAQTAYPHQPLARHLRMSPRRLHDIRELEPKLWAALAPHLDAPDSDAFLGVVSGGRRWMDFPPRFGGCLGYWAMRHWAEVRGASPASREVLAAPTKAVLDTYLGHLRTT